MSSPSPSGVQWYQTPTPGLCFYWSAHEQCYVYYLNGTRVRPDPSSVRTSAASETASRASSQGTASSNQVTPRRLVGDTATQQQQVAGSTGSYYASSPPNTYELSSSTNPSSSQHTSSASARPLYSVSTPVATQPRPTAVRQVGLPNTYPVRPSAVGSYKPTVSSPVYEPPAGSASTTQPISIAVRSRSNTSGSAAYSSSPYGPGQPQSVRGYNSPITGNSANTPGVGTITAISEGVHSLGVNAEEPRQPEPNLVSTERILRETGQDAAGVHYDIVRGPPDLITDPQLRTRFGVSAHVRVRGTQGDNEVFDQSYRVRKQPSKFFVTGKVFFVLWAEPAGANSDAGTDITRDNRFQEPIHAKVRRFVVIRSSDRYCSAIPILTHGGQGVAKRGVRKSDFAVIYTGKASPAIRPEEQHIRGEAPMRPSPIRVDPDEKGSKLNPCSRVNFGKVYTIEHNVKVKSWGMVNRDSMQALLFQFRDVWATMFGAPAGLPGSNPASAQGPAVPSSSTGQTNSGAPQPLQRYGLTREQLYASTQARGAGQFAPLTSQPRTGTASSRVGGSDASRPVEEEDDSSDEESGEESE